MTNCEYKGSCILKCPKSQLDCVTYKIYQETQADFESQIEHQAYRNTRLKRMFRGEFPRRVGGMR